MWRRSSKAQALQRDYLRIAIQQTPSGQKNAESRVPQVQARRSNDTAI
jgi:hypothetical protein